MLDDVDMVGTFHPREGMWIMISHGCEMESLTIPKDVRIVMYSLRNKLKECIWSVKEFIKMASMCSTYRSFLHLMAGPWFSQIRKTFSVYREGDFVPNIVFWSLKNFESGLFKLPMREVGYKPEWIPLGWSKRKIEDSAKERKRIRRKETTLMEEKMERLSLQDSEELEAEDTPTEKKKVRLTDLLNALNREGGGTLFIIACRNKCNEEDKEFTYSLGIPLSAEIKNQGFEIIDPGHPKAFIARNIVKNTQALAIYNSWGIGWVDENYNLLKVEYGNSQTKFIGYITSDREVWMRGSEELYIRYHLFQISEDRSLYSFDFNNLEVYESDEDYAAKKGKSMTVRNGIILKDLLLTNMAIYQIIRAKVLIKIRDEVYKVSPSLFSIYLSRIQIGYFSPYTSSQLESLLQQYNGPLLERFWKKFEKVHY